MAHAELEFFSSLVVAGDMYRERARELEKEKARKKEFDLGDYKPNSKSWEQKNSEIDTWYESEKMKLNDECTGSLLNQIKNMRDGIKASVRMVDTRAYNELSAIKDMRVSSREMESLIERFGGADYWCNKLLVEMCMRNNIVSDRAELRLSPDADTQLRVLDEIEEHINGMLSDDYSDVTIPNLSWLRERKVQEWEAQYSNGLYSKYYDAQDWADRMYVKLLDAENLVERGMGLKNCLQNCEDAQITDRLLDRIAKNENVFTPQAIKIAGASEIIKDFQSGKRTVKELSDGQETQLTDAEKVTAQKLSEMKASEQ